MINAGKNVKKEIQAMQTTTPLNWREHMTEEERVQMATIDIEIDALRTEAMHYTAQRETIRRRITSRVRWERTKAMREAG